MTSQAIIEVWGDTKEVFEQFGIAINSKQLQTLVSGEKLQKLLKALNDKVGSSSNTCIEGG
ncbi:hypothetical protein CIB95_10680 [Lottiidibacillus patelloidae]|uniref:Uncharacterized protein n=2 Tax=Lottiidibacillus patelloidae TaxID=2670334 RepID=A0A263BTZ6_9BACI|nr:hypothetical protein CIB95_10680 [Lottiidibacillus patelloidae]